MKMDAIKIGSEYIYAHKITAELIAQVLQTVSRETFLKGSNFVLEVLPMEVPGRVQIFDGANLVAAGNVSDWIVIYQEPQSESAVAIIPDIVIRNLKLWSSTLSVIEPILIH